MRLKDDIEKFRDAQGLVFPVQRYHSTERRLFYYSLYVILLVRRGEVKVSDLEEFEKIVSRCFEKTGILNTKPGSNLCHTSKETYIAVFHAAQLMNSKMSWMILNAGNVRRFLFFKWFFKNVKADEFKLLDKKTFKSWFGKWPHVVCHMQWCSNVKGIVIEPHLFREICQAFYLMLVLKQDPLQVLTQFIMLEAAKDKSELILAVRELWTAQMLRQFPGGMKVVLANEVGPNHPLVKYWV